MSDGAAVIVGAGRLGLSLAAALADAGEFGTVAVLGRRLERPEFLADFEGVRYLADPEAAARLAAEAGEGLLVLVLAVSDDALEETGRQWSELLGRVRNGGQLIALHTSGFHPSSVVAPLARRAAASLGSWHPLTALAEPSRDAFAGVTVGVEGSADALDCAREISRQLGATPVDIPPEGKARYHAAAVFASNYLVACLRIALTELETASGGALDVTALAPLARAAIDNVARNGIIAGTTGPLVRGDLHTVAGHIDTLDPTRAALYRALGRELLAVARERNPREVYEALSALLASG